MVFTPGYPAINRGACRARGAAWEIRAPAWHPEGGPCSIILGTAQGSWACPPLPEGLARSPPRLAAPTRPWYGGLFAPPHPESMPLPGTLCLVSTMSALLLEAGASFGGGRLLLPPACLIGGQASDGIRDIHPSPPPKTSSDVSREHLHRPVRSPPAPCGP